MPMLDQENRDPHAAPSAKRQQAGEIAALKAKLEQLERAQAAADARAASRSDSRRDSESCVALRPRSARTTHRAKGRSPLHQVARTKSRRETLEQPVTSVAVTAQKRMVTTLREVDEGEEQEEESGPSQLRDRNVRAVSAEATAGDGELQNANELLMKRKSGAIRFADETTAAEAVPEPATARVTRSKRAKLDELRSEHEQMVASMKQHELRKAAAAQQLLAHYKNEAERLQTLTQKSRAVATSRRIDSLERENLDLQQQIMDAEEKLLALEGNRGAQHIFSIREQKKTLRAYQAVTGLCLSLTDEAKLHCKTQHGMTKLAFELDLDERQGVCEYNPVELQGLNATNAPTFLSETIHFDLEQLPAFHFKVQTAVHAERLQGTSEQKREQQENARPRPPKSKLPVPKPATFG